MRLPAPSNYRSHRLVPKSCSIVGPPLALPGQPPNPTSEVASHSNTPQLSGGELRASTSSIHLPATRQSGPFCDDNPATNIPVALPPLSLDLPCSLHLYAEFTHSLRPSPLPQRPGRRPLGTGDDRIDRSLAAVNVVAL